MNALRSKHAATLFLVILSCLYPACRPETSARRMHVQSQVVQMRSEDYSRLSAEDAIAAFAATTGGDWNLPYGILGYDHDKPGPDFSGAGTVLPWGALALVKELGLGYVRPALTKLPDLSLFPNLIDLRLSGNRITNIDALAGLLLRYVSLDQNPISSISALGTCTDLTGITASGTNITHLPNLERLSKLQSLVVGETPLTTLDGIEMLPNKIDLVVTGCRELVDISALLAGTVNRLVVDDEMLVRFRRWLDVHTSEIKKANPNFEVTTFYSGE